MLYIYSVSVRGQFAATKTYDRVQKKTFSIDDRNYIIYTHVSLGSSYVIREFETNIDDNFRP